MNKKLLITLLIISTIFSTSIVSAGLFDSADNNESNGILVENVTVTKGDYGAYDLACCLTPKKDFNYLEAYMVFYDSDDAVVEKCPIVWNTANPAKDQLIKVSGEAYVSSSASPVRVEVFFSDGVSNDEKDALYCENVTLS